MQRNTLLLLALLVTLAAGLWLAAGTLGGAASLQPPHQAPSAAAHPPSPQLETDLGPLDSAAPPAPERQAAQAAPTGSRDLLIVDAATGAPLAGVRAFAASDPIAGPTGSDGRLIFTPPAGLHTTFWAPGWGPAEFLRRNLPLERVELTAADARIEIIVDHLAPEEGILLQRLEPLDWTSTPKSAWSAPLEIAAPHRVLGASLAPGRYLAYVWIGARGDQGIALEPVEVELVPGASTTVRLDASVRPDDEVDS